MSKKMFSLMALAPAVMGNVMNEEPKFHVSTDPNARTCHTPVLSEAEVLSAQKETDHILSQRKKNHAVYVESTVIDVYYHIITCADGTGALSDAHLADQLTVMNDAYAGSGFSFVEAGRDVTVNADWCAGLEYGSTAEFDMKQALRKGDGTALNFYTGNLGSNLLGWATFPSSLSSSPWRDGVINKYTTLPGAGTGAYSLGMTAVHEVGHWLGLYHTFQGGCGAPGDSVADTPEVASPNYGCPGTVDSCPDDGLGADMTNNFMDYTNDACMDVFTDGQRTRMLQQFNAYRLDSPCTVNCGPTPSAAPTVSMAPTTAAEMCIDVVVTMNDSWGDGWNGNYLYFDGVANMATTELKVTLANGFSGTASVCLTPGIYSAFACGGTWINEVSWSIDAYGVTGAADATCGNGAQTFEVLPAGASAVPTTVPTPAPTRSPTFSPTAAPTHADNVHVVMYDSYGDGWNGNYLYFGDHTSASTIKVTVPNGHGSTRGLYLPPGDYSPYACGGTWDQEVSWTIQETGMTGGADNSCAPAPGQGSFTVSADGTIQTPAPTFSPTAAPTPVPTSSSPTFAPTQCNVIVHMADSYGDGWNGNKLYFDDVANMATTSYKLTFTSGHSKTKSICLPPGTYSPFACGGGWPNEVSWEVEGYGISGGASSICQPTSGSFTVLGDGETLAPTEVPTSAPTKYPTEAPTASPTVQGVPTSAPTHSPTPATTPSSTSGEGECCCDAKINEVLANQATMLTALSGSATNSDSSTNSEETTSSSSSNGQITLDSSSVIIGTVLCATLFAGAVVAAVFYRKKVQELEEVLGRHAPLGSLELGGLGLSGNAY